MKIKLINTWKSKKYFVLVISILLATGALYKLNMVNNKSKISYNEFLIMVENQEVKNVKVDLNGSKFSFKTKNGDTFITDNPKVERFKETLLQENIEVKEKTNVKISDILVIFVILLGTFVVFTSIDKITSVGQKNFISENDKSGAIPRIRFNDLAGCEDTKLDMMNLVSILKDPTKYSKMGAKIPKGVMLYGSPGTGKTLTAKAIAGEANVPFFSVSGSDFVEMYVGVGAKRVRELFQKARENAPSIIFIDEIDAIGGKRGNSPNNNEQEQTINALLKEMDGFDVTDGVIVIGATNRLDSLDDALIRAGRFDRHISVSLPNVSEREKIFKIHAENKKVSKDIDFKQLSKETVNFSGAMINTLLNEAAISAVNKGKSEIDRADIDQVFTEMIMKGKEKSEINKVRTKEEIELIAYHEAGHTLATKLLTDNIIPKVTIIENTSGFGGVTFSIPQKEGLFTKMDLLNRIKILYAGRVAEIILYNNDESLITTGASNDIELATNVMFQMVNDFGMSDKFGLLKISNIMKDNSLVLKEMQALSSSLYNETYDIINSNKSKLKLIANELIEKETLTGSEIDKLLM